MTYNRLIAPDGNWFSLRPSISLGFLSVSLRSLIGFGVAPFILNECSHWIHSARIYVLPDSLDPSAPSTGTEGNFGVIQPSPPEALSEEQGVLPNRR
jgi:hypothetical protein